LKPYSLNRHRCLLPNPEQSQNMRELRKEIKRKALPKFLLRPQGGRVGKEIDVK